jgi:hypothetical protein
MVAWQPARRPGRAGPVLMRSRLLDTCFCPLRVIRVSISVGIVYEKGAVCQDWFGTLSLGLGGPGVASGFKMRVKNFVGGVGGPRPTPALLRHTGESHPVFEFAVGSRIKSGMTSTTHLLTLRLCPPLDCGQGDTLTADSSSEHS